LTGIFLSISTSLFGQDQLEYDFARECARNHNYLLAYKHLIIYKYTNLRYFEAPANAGSLRQVDGYIASYEEYLGRQVMLSPTERSKVKGYTPGKADSLPPAALGPVKLKPL
jgi:hypothetical protein